MWAWSTCCFAGWITKTKFMAHICDISHCFIIIISLYGLWSCFKLANEWNHPMKQNIRKSWLYQKIAQYMPLIAPSQSPSADLRTVRWKGIWHPYGQFKISPHYWQKSNKFLLYIHIQQYGELIKEPTFSHRVSCELRSMSTTFWKKSFSKW